MDYEKNIEELNLILNKLDNEELPMKESIELFKKAEKLFKECNDYLEKARGDFYKIKQDLDNYREEKVD